MIVVMHPAFVVEPEQEDVAAANEVTRRLEAALQKLEPRHERVIRMRMDGHTWQECADALSVGKERARQIFNQSLVRLKQKNRKPWQCNIVLPEEVRRDRLRENKAKQRAERYARHDVEATRRLEWLQAERERLLWEQARFRAEIDAKIANPHHDEKLGQGVLFFASTNITVNFSKTGRPPVHIGQFEVWKMHPKLAANAEALGQGVILVSDD